MKLKSAYSNTSKLFVVMSWGMKKKNRNIFREISGLTLWGIKLLSRGSCLGGIHGEAESLRPLSSHSSSYVHRVSFPLGSPENWFRDSSTGFSGGNPPGTFSIHFRQYLHVMNVRHLEIIRDEDRRFETKIDEERRREKMWDEEKRCKTTRDVLKRMQKWRDDVRRRDKERRYETTWDERRRCEMKVTIRNVERRWEANWDANKMKLYETKEG